MARMIKRFKMKGSDFSVESFVTINDPEVVYEIIHGIFYGVAKGLESVDLFEISTNDDDQVFSVHRRSWIKSLNRCMDAMIEIEDYETCTEIKKALSILEKNIK
jgi:hypothetical protein